MAAVGSPPKTIRELVGRVATGDEELSVAVLGQGRNPGPYETPGGAQHVAVCVPAFSPATVHREG